MVNGGMMRGEEGDAGREVQSPILRLDDEVEPLVTNGLDSDQDDSSSRQDDVEVEIEGTIQGEPDPTPDLPPGPRFVPYKHFEKLPTVLPSVLSMCSSVIVVCSVFAVPFACLDNNGTDKNVCPVEAFSLLIYFHLFYWFIHLIIDPYLKKHHKRNRMKGYLEFYLDTKNMRRAPFYLVSVGNFGMLLVGTILHDFCDAFPGSCGARFSKVDWLRGLITIEAMAIFFLFLYYIDRVKKFNRSGQYPDVMRYKYMRALGCTLVLKFPRENEECTPEEEMHISGINRRELELMAPHEYVFGRTWREEDEFVRVMQAELIRFLITQIKRKNRKVVTLAKILTRYTDDVQGLVSQGIEM